MSVNLRDRIRSHYIAVDTSQETIEWAEIVARLDNEVTIAVAPHRSRRSRAWVAVCPRGYS